VIHNLLSNAIKFCSKNDGKITISITKKIEVSIHITAKELKRRF
jgi:signal transduction histidine kinase